MLTIALVLIGAIIIWLLVRSDLMYDLDAFFTGVEKLIWTSIVIGILILLFYLSKLL